jgi:hypothetical protein
LHTHLRTATGTGDGTSSTTGVRITFTTGTGAGTSSSASIGAQIIRKAATGEGTSTEAIVHRREHLRVTTSAGQGTQECVGARIERRTGTGVGQGADIPGAWIKSLIFRPPAEADFPWATYRSNTPANRLFSRVEPGARRLNVYKLQDGTYTSVDPRNDNSVVKTYFGGHNNFVSEEEKADLVAAGFEVT